MERKKGISESYDFTCNNPVWIPYYQILGATLPAEKGTEMRTNRRLLSLISIISLAKASQRYQLIFDNQILTVAAPEDLTEALYIMQNSSGMPPYKVKFFNEVFYPLYKRKLQEKLQEQERLEEEVIIEEGARENKLIGQNDLVSSNVTLTANEICDYYNLKNPKKPINSDNLRKTYLNELVSDGYIEALDVKESNTKKVYYPIIFPLEEEQKAINERTTTEETREFKTHPEFSIHYKINVPTYYIPLPTDWLNFEVLKLWKCGIDIGNGPYYPPSLSSPNTSNHDNNNGPIHEEVLPPIAAAIQFLDIEREEGEKKEVQENNDNNNNSSNIGDLSNKRKKITMTQFVQRYNESTGILSRHFSRPIFDDSCNKIFGKIQYLGPVTNINTIKTGINSNSSVS